MEVRGKKLIVPSWGLRGFGGDSVREGLSAGDGSLVGLVRIWGAVHCLVQMNYLLIMGWMMKRCDC